MALATSEILMPLCASCWHALLDIAPRDLCLLDIVELVESLDCAGELDGVAFFCHVLAREPHVQAASVCECVQPDAVCTHSA